jgi:hypothetical protein
METLHKNGTKGIADKVVNQRSTHTPGKAY